MVMATTNPGPTAHVGSKEHLAVLPTLSDPRLQVAAVIIMIHLLGQIALGFRVSITQILVAIGTCAVIEASWTLHRTGKLAWPASAMLTGSSVGLIFRVIGTDHGDWWSTRGWYWYLLVSGGSLLTKYILRYRGAHLFNPSNLGLVVAFLLLGSSRVEPLAFWWAPLDGWMIAVYLVILAGGLAITARLKLLGMAVAFWATLAPGIGVLAASGHCITARWSFEPVCGARFWWVIVTSPEIIIFLFFMITDPKTVPTGRVGRVAFGSAVAAVSTLLIAPQTTEFGAKVALLGGLVIVCAIRPLFNRILPGQARDEDGFGAFVGTHMRSGTRVLTASALMIALVLLFGVGVIAAGTPARGPVHNFGTFALDTASEENDAEAEIALLPVVNVDPKVADLDSHLAGDGAQELAVTLTEILEVEAAAILEGNPEVLPAIDYGNRLATMQARIGRGELVIERYSFQSLYLTVVFPFGVQGGASPGLVATAALDEVTYATTGEELGRQQWTCDAVTFSFVASGDGRWLLVDADTRSACSNPSGRDGVNRVDSSDGAVLTESTPYTPSTTSTAVVAVGFVDLTELAGLSYEQRIPQQAPDCLFGTARCGLGAQTGGVSVVDFDSDGWPDLYVTRIKHTDVLFRNNGDGTFEDITTASGLGDFVANTNGAAWGDIDNDGDPDLYLTTVDDERFYLFINDGEGHLSEDAVARGAAVENPFPHHGTSVNFGDYDLDGWLDMYVAEWRTDLLAPDAPTNSRLLRNVGIGNPGHFEDVTETSGVDLVGYPTGQKITSGVYAWSGSFADIDGDGFPELLIAADYETSRLFWNNGDGTFTDGTAAAGVGTDENGMGSAVGDYDGDGDLDWFVTSIFDSAAACPVAIRSPCTGNRLYRNDGGRLFSDQTGTKEEGVRDGHWGWGAAFIDFDNDSDLDIAMTNGVNFTVQPESARWHNDPFRLWRNDGSDRWTEVAAAVGLVDYRSGKGLVTFDYDRDGDRDIFVVNNNEDSRLFRNDIGGSWLDVDTIGTISNRDGIGARVSLTVSPDSEAMIQEVGVGSHFLGQSERIVHFGLGSDVDSIFEVEVYWPTSGQTQTFSDVAPDQRLVVVEP